MSVQQQSTSCPMHSVPDWRQKCTKCNEALNQQNDQFLEAISENASRREVSALFKNLAPCARQAMQGAYDTFMSRVICTRCNRNVSDSNKCELCYKQINQSLTELIAAVKNTTPIQKTIYYDDDSTNPNTKFQQMLFGISRRNPDAAKHFSISNGGFAFMYRSTN